MRIRAAELCKGIKLKTFAVFVVIPVYIASFLICLFTGIYCTFFDGGEYISDIFADAGIKISGFARDTVTVFLFICAFFLLVCLFSLIFTLKCEFFYAADKNQCRPVKFLSFSGGLRYLRYWLCLSSKKLNLLFKMILPLSADIIIFALFLKVRGMTRFSAGVSLVFTVFVLVFSVSVTFILFRSYDMGAYLMYLNPMLSPSSALTSSVEKSEKRLVYLAMCKLSVILNRFTGFFWITLPFSVPSGGVFFALVCEKIYGENKTEVKKPGITFYVNKNTKIKFAEKSQ